VLGTVLHAGAGVFLVALGHFVDEQNAVPDFVGVEQVRRQRVAAAVTLAEIGVEPDAHARCQPAGVNSMGRVRRERSPGV
jgi:hypothetical protein